MKICHVQGIFSPEHGGPAQSLTNYCRGQVAAGHRVEVWALEGFPYTSPAIRLPSPVEMHIFPVEAPARLGKSARMREALAVAEPADVYHLHGTWLRAMRYAAVAARRHGKPYVLEVMGMYEPWALWQKGLRKLIARWWYQDRILRGAACLHVNSGQEAASLRKLGFRNPIAVVPVGVDLQKVETMMAGIADWKLDAQGQKSGFAELSGLEGQPFALFLSRLHPKKGLDLLIRAWAEVQKADAWKPKTKGWRLVIAGAGEPDYVRKCRQLAEHLGVARQCLWLDYVDEPQKCWLFANAHFYVLPSASENFGNVVAEALAHGTPVITTIHTPWADLEKHRCGWLVDNTEAGLCPAMTAAMAMDSGERTAMGRAALELVRGAYSLELVLRQMESVYRWVTTGDPPPACVWLDANQEPAPGSHNFRFGGSVVASAQQNQLRVVHVTSSISRLAGGPFFSARYLTQEIQKHGLQVKVLGLEDQFSETDKPRWFPLPVQTFPVLGPRWFGYSPELRQHLADDDADMVHLHGVWQYPTSAVLRWARATGRPYVVSAHGMLEPWALNRSRFKKAAVNWLYQNAMLREANCLRATAASEVETYRRLGLKNPIALIGNGVAVPEALQRTEDGGRTSDVCLPSSGLPISGLRSPISGAVGGSARRRALFISRVHPKKGLLDLVRAWAAVQTPDARRQTSDARSPSSDWELVIMGPDEGGHLAQVMGLVRELGLQEQIRYGGEVWQDDAKWRCYQEADLFVLPSYSENFGLVIAEALGCGVPVITTRATPWQDLETHRCGWWIDPGKEPLAQALRRAMAVPVEELQAMGRRGRQLVLDKYSWAPIGRQMAETYEWLAGRRDKPECVQLKG